MRSSTSKEQLLFNPEIEKECKKNRKQKRITAGTQFTEQNQQQNMAENEEEVGQNRPLRDFALPVVTDTTSGIRRPPIQANNFEIKPAIIQMVQGHQFGGAAIEDPNQHIADFLDICDMFKINGVSQDAIRLRLFPFSLRDKAKSWLQTMPAGSITTWEDLANKFLAKYFPPAKTAKMRNELTSFMQQDLETLHEAWERFKDLLRKCPHHGLPDWLQLQSFYNGLSNSTRTLVDAAAGGSFMSKSYEGAFQLLDEMASNAYQWPVDRGNPRRTAGIHEVEAFTALSAKVDSIAKQIGSLAMNINAVHTPVTAEICELCSGPHLSVECQVGNPFAPSAQEHCHFMGNFNRQNNPYSNTYNPGWRNHPNFSWKTNQPLNSTSQPMNYPPKQPHPQTQPFNQAGPSNKINNDDVAAQLQSQAASIKNLEVQIGQLASLLNARKEGALPSTTEANPREQIKAITLRSGKILTEPAAGKEKSGEEKKERIKSCGEKENVASERKEEEKGSKLFPDNPPPYVPKIPYPQRFQQQKVEKQFSKFLDVFKKLHINIPFAEALEQMPAYAKFMKEILSRKRKLEEYETVALTEECSAVLQKKLPPKLKDPGSFTIPCTIGNATFEKALCDLGASINLMPLSVFRKLGLGEAKPTTVSLQLADRSVKYPRGIIEDVLVKVGKFIFPADFVVLDMEEDQDIPIILGRPFLATGRTLIDVQKGQLILRVKDEEVIFNVFKAIQHPDVVEECLRVDVVDLCVKDVEIMQEEADPLEICIRGERSEEGVYSKECEQQLEALPHIFVSKHVEELGVSASKLTPSIEKAPPLELKPLPDHLKYLFLGEDSTLPVIVAAGLAMEQEEKLLRVLRDHKLAIGWTIADIKGISPSICMHRIFMEEGYKPSIEHQRRLNPNMKEVVKKEILKWLDAGIIYLISDSSWVSPVQVVPKKGGMTVVANGNNELIPTRTVTGWRVCIDYRKLNKATRKDHFPLPFIDQMLDRLAGHAFYCFLDGYSGYNQILIAPKDQEKTTFTCPYGTFAFRRMPFGLCNAPATFQRCMLALFSDMVESIIEVFMDDFSVFGDSFDSCLKILECVLRRCEETNLVLN